MPLPPWPHTSVAEPRPTADDVATLLQAITDDRPLAPVPWPAPPQHAGDASRLLTGGPYAVVGPLGSGRKRMLQEARWLWYRKGYRSLAARCVPDRPYAALRDLLVEMFRSTVSTSHDDMAGNDASLLQAVWPSWSWYLPGSHWCRLRVNMRARSECQGEG